MGVKLVTWKREEKKKFGFFKAIVSANMELKKKIELYLKIIMVFMFDCVI
jgi:hypothetical protein